MNVKKTKLGPSKWQVFINDVDPVSRATIKLSGIIFKVGGNWYLNKQDDQRACRTMTEAVELLRNEYQQQNECAVQPLTAAQRKAIQRARNKEMGLVEYSITVPNTPEAKRKVKEYCMKLVKQFLE